jgi:peptide-methionine (S)-S-oxide reductase
MKGATEKATFGGGCFWHVETAFRSVRGVVSACVGYMGGTLENPTYEDVCTGLTGYAEVAHVEYDPAIVSYEELLDLFWQIHDPTALNRQGLDVGTQYRSVIFFQNAEHETAAKEFKEKVQRRFGRRIVTEITPASEFYRAEEYHQQFDRKNGLVCS